MTLNPHEFLNAELANADPSWEVAFAHPEDAPSPQEVEALRHFLREFEASASIANDIELFAADDPHP